MQNNNMGSMRLIRFDCPYYNTMYGFFMTMSCLICLSADLFSASCPKVPICCVSRTSKRLTYPSVYSFGVLHLQVAYSFSVPCLQVPHSSVSHNRAYSVQYHVPKCLTHSSTSCHCQINRATSANNALPHIKNALMMIWFARLSKCSAIILESMHW